MWVFWEFCVLLRFNRISIDFVLCYLYLFFYADQVGINNQMNPNQMNPQMMGRMNPATMNAVMSPGMTSMNPGMNPGMNPAMNPAMNPGINPSMNPGMNPGQMNSSQIINQLVGNPNVSGMPGGPQPTQMGGPNVLPNQNMPQMSQPNIPNQMAVSGQFIRIYCKSTVLLLKITSSVAILLLLSLFLNCVY